MGSSWSYGSWIYNYLCNQCLSPLKLWVWMPFSWGVLDTTLCDKVCRVTGQWFTPISSTNKTDSHEIIEILLKVALKGNFVIFYMLAKYVPGDIKYIFTKFYRHISTNNKANHKWVIFKKMKTFHFQRIIWILNDMKER